MTEKITAQNDVSALILDGIPCPDELFPQCLWCVALSSPNIGRFTGTLITPKHVLTCAHVAWNIDPANGQPDETAVIIEGQTHSGSIITHPQFPIVDLPREQLSSDSETYDIGIIELDEAVTHIPPAVINNRIPVNGDDLTIVGYGHGGSGASGADGVSGIKRLGYIDDSDLDVDGNTYTTVYPWMLWVTHHLDESGHTSGDSGGPYYSDGAIVAITRSSFTLGQAEETDLWNTVKSSLRIDKFISWINDNTGLETVHAYTGSNNQDFRRKEFQFKIPTNNNVFTTEWLEPK